MHYFYSKKKRIKRKAKVKNFHYCVATARKNKKNPTAPPQHQVVSMSAQPSPYLYFENAVDELPLQHHLAALRVEQIVGLGVAQVQADKAAQVLQVPHALLQLCQHAEQYARAHAAQKRLDS
jgi:hypothetical protein